MYGRDDGPIAPLEPIIPESCIIAAVSLKIEGEVKAAQLTQPDPGNGPPGRLYVPDSVKSSVLQWAHSLKLSCHPGLNRTLAFLRRRFWWPSMEVDVKSFVSACPVCAQNKSSTQPSAGLLHLLPVPRRPWSHLGLDFVSGLPASAGNTVILTVVDRFSKFTRFLPLPKLPSAKETAELLVKEVFCLQISFQIEGLSSPPPSGKLSVPLLEPLSA